MKTALCAALLLAARAAGAAEINVDTSGVDVAGCGAPDAPCATIQFAYDAAADGDVIRIGPGTYHENVRLLRSIDATLVGAGAPWTVVDGDDQDPAIYVEYGANQKVVIADLTLTHGLWGGLSGFLSINGYPLVMSRCRITDNHWDLDLNGGGGIFFQGNLVLADSAVYGNRSLAGGGGIYSQIGDLSLVNVTVSGNQAAAEGGGIAAYSRDLIVLGSTITGNSAGTAGGGLWLYDSGTGNRFENTVVAGNTAPASTDCKTQMAALKVSGYNLFGSLDGCALTGDLTGNLVGVGPLLGPLADNGGLTPSHALLAGSPALDAGDPAGCKDLAFGQLLPVDQRGRPRPTAGACRCDMGAFELKGGEADAGPDLRIDPGASATLSGDSCCASPTYRWLEGAAEVCPPSTDPTCLVTPAATTVYTLEAQCGAQTAADGVKVVVDFLPADLGNTVTLVRSGKDLELRWTPGGGCGYNVYRSDAKGIWPPVAHRSGLAGGSATLSTLPPGFHLYRVAGVSCQGTEGP